MNETTANGPLPTQFGLVEVVRLLLARVDVDVNKAKPDGATALIIASQIGHTDVVRLLLAHRDVDVNKAAANGATALKSRRISVTSRCCGSCSRTGTSR